MCPKEKARQKIVTLERRLSILADWEFELLTSGVPATDPRCREVHDKYAALFLEKEELEKSF